MQDVSGGAPVAVEGVNLPLWGMEVDVERARADIRVWPAATLLLCCANHQAHFSQIQTFRPFVSQSALQSLLDGMPTRRHCVGVQAVAAADDDRGNTKAQQFLSSVGLGAFADQLQDLKLSECTSSPDAMTSPGYHMSLCDTVAQLSAGVAHRCGWLAHW